MAENQYDFPTEVLDLPSKGLLYSKDNPLSSGTIEIKYMTAKEEDILTSTNLIQKGIVLDKLFESILADKSINIDDMLVGDKNAVMLGARILGYGKEYEVEITDPDSGLKKQITVDLTTLKFKEQDDSIFKDGENKFTFELPNSKRTLEFKLLTHGDEVSIARELKGAKKINKKASNDLTTRMKYIITSIDGDYEKKTIREYVDSEFLARDARELRNYIKKIQPSVDLTFDYEDQRGNVTTIDIPVGIDFFWPDATV